MKIKSVSCRQFAGMRNLKPLQFEDGLNIVYGPNESGKSTLTGLIYSLLWRNCNVGDKLVTDKTYKTMYFPAEVKGGVSGKTIDGRLVIDGDNGEYTISKKWAVKGSGDLETPTTVLDENTDSQAYSETMKSLLKYGEGVYREAIFANQKTIDSVLQALLGGKLDSDLSSVASSAMLDMGGISSEKFLEQIDLKMKDLANYWDLRTNGPKGGRGIDNKITRFSGKILKAYYAMEDSRKKLKELQEKADAVGKADRDYVKELEAYEKVDGELKDFNEYYTHLVNLKNTRSLLQNAETDRSRRKDADSKWPGLIEDYEKAQKLEQELNRALDILLWQEIESIQRQVAETNKKISGLHPVDEEDVKKATIHTEEIRRIEKRLKDFNALIAFTLQEGYELIVTSDVDGRRIDLDEGAFEVAEAVQIEIPGVATLHLSAVDVDVEETKTALSDHKTALKGILDRYREKSADDLESARKNEIGDRKELNLELRRLDSDFKRAIGGKDIAEIKAKYESALAVPTRSKEEIQTDIEQMTTKSIGTFISLCKQDLDRYENDYESQEKNKAEIQDLTKKIEGYKGIITAADQIPEKFRTISDPEGWKRTLEKNVREALQKRDEVHEKLMEARAAIKAAEEADDYMPIEELKETLADDEVKFDQYKKDYAAWKQIREVAVNILNSADANPLQQFEVDFRNYLAMLSADGITLSSLGTKMEADIYSGDNRMTYELLSEGTKDTVALAFRLAVIKFLFPDGGGFVVFDDPFTDMDAERRARACNLLKEFAENNQIIFATCDRSYIDLLGGNLIDFTNMR